MTDLIPPLHIEMLARQGIASDAKKKQINPVYELSARRIITHDDDGTPIVWLYRVDRYGIPRFFKRVVRRRIL